MTLFLDHVVVAVHDLERATADYRALGFTVLSGGVHANGATHNALIVFEDGTYIELLARTGKPPTPNMIDFSVLLTGSEGVVGYALGTDDIDSAAARLRAARIAIGAILPGERRRPDGTLIQWRLMQIEPDGQAHGFAPFLIQDVTARELRVPTDQAAATHANGAVGIDAVDIVVKSFEASLKRYQAILGDFPHG
ncbi:MAG: VOC family protein [Chloroflexota bacterium]|nr:VOC family protein [Chloroflexota bacterium]